jgi:hypothetical protein
MVETVQHDSDIKRLHTFIIQQDLHVHAFASDVDASHKVVRATAVSALIFTAANIAFAIAAIVSAAAKRRKSFVV